MQSVLFDFIFFVFWCSEINTACVPPLLTISRGQNQQPKYEVASDSRGNRSTPENMADTHQSQATGQVKQETEVHLRRKMRKQDTIVVSDEELPVPKVEHPALADAPDDCVELSEEEIISSGDFPVTEDDILPTPRAVKKESPANIDEVVDDKIR